MKFPAVITRIALTITLILVVTLLPHHHHGGELPCWIIEKENTAQHDDCHPEHKENSLPCDDSSCSLQSIKFFIQSERLAFSPLFLLGLLPEELVVQPAYNSLSPHRITVSSYPLTACLLQALSLRGPPMY